MFMRNACYIIPLKKFVEKRGKGLGMLNMYREVSRDREQTVLLASPSILIITGGAIELEQQ
ncbi:hypothetical protein A3844_04510 [Paenibacillus helianthi]|uniref:Uncharacterized protein n=1 Tax=Paenibacillus helianthi TaxID=1349432 RepID=A0ABX3ET30_9BACL|nr:hypothetical protein [Paenibacillus helianthi]OKP69486.1 hypothetical protein A3842_25610 [Paenibacillus sp. P3E]OKP89907.1 hypothetical protein A3848_14160 [Paenibacillus sp. P32E]OKP91101.1 hypothetical protein A3844_04510 [Paenibacillus helianthi]